MLCSLVQVTFFFFLKIPLYLQFFPRTGFQGLELPCQVQEWLSTSPAKLLPEKLTQLAGPTGQTKVGFSAARPALGFKLLSFPLVRWGCAGGGKSFRFLLFSSGVWVMKTITHSKGWKAVFK